MEKSLIFTIFGGTGNLTFQKLMPAFYQLYLENKLNKNIKVISIGRRDYNNEKYRKLVKDSLLKNVKSFSEETYSDFINYVLYYKMDYTLEDGYKSFNKFLHGIDNECGCRGNRVYYLATSPVDFPNISVKLKENGLLETDGFVRAVFEKPFGVNLESATKINEIVSTIFGEDNIYRIDHYLGKEMIQNIETIRFSNKIFSQVWNKDAIDNIQITVKENVGVLARGGYYDNSGALRDMVQNHLLQILALIAMEPPLDFEPANMRKEKIKVIKNLKINKNLSDKELIFSQYEGYKNEPKVDKDSTTETYVAMKCFVGSDRFKGVPFYLRTGKALDGKEAQVIIEFKVDSYKDKLLTDVKPNLLVIKIQPEEGVYFRINTKEPREESKLMSVSMDYCQSCNIYYKSPAAYERLIRDIIIGDKTLFTSWEEVESAWKLVSEFTVKTKEKQRHMTSYKVGSKGPEEATKLLEKDGRIWWELSDLKSEFFEEM